MRQGINRGFSTAETTQSWDRWQRGEPLTAIGRAFAKQIAAAVGVTASTVEEAFAAVRREDFFGKGPWPIFRYREMYAPIPNDDEKSGAINPIPGRELSLATSHFSTSFTI
jgi:hypothetical protein